MTKETMDFDTNTFYKLKVWKRSSPREVIYIGKNRQGQYFFAGEIIRPPQNKLEIEVYKLSYPILKEGVIIGRITGWNDNASYGKAPNQYEREYLQERFRKIRSTKNKEASSTQSSTFPHSPPPEF